VRVAIGGIWHETNTFAAGRTTLADFRAYQYAEGDDLLARYTGTGTELGGMIEAARALGMELVPTVYAGAVPSGIIAREALDAVASTLDAALAAAGPLDGALLVLHGAAVAEGVDDADAHVLAVVRRRVGALPIAATFDYHANLGPGMVEGADVLVGYDTFPHTDMAARGGEAGHLLHRMIATDARPRAAHVKLPLLTAPINQLSGAPPLDAIYARLHQIERTGAIWCGALAMGFPYADIPELGASALAYADTQEAADAAAREIASRLWQAREAFLPRLISPAEAVARAIAAPHGPIVLVDAADNVGGGAAGDGTAILAELIRQNAQDAVVVIADPEGVAVARDGGAKFDALVGGKTDDKHGPPVRVVGRVARYWPEARYRHVGSYMTGTETSMGAVAVVIAGGVRVVLTSRRTMPFDRGQLDCVDLPPERQKIIVAKSALAWRAAFGDEAADHIEVDTPGVGASNVRRFDYRRRPRPMFPLDPRAGFPTT
jgi:microcystin degradation protein MlrC